MDIKDLFFKKIPSTHLYAKKHLKDFDKNVLTVITAEEQTAGIGRSKRGWHSPKGNLYATLHFVLPKDTLYLGSLGQVLSYSLIMVLIKEGFFSLFKWPNDLLLNRKKCAGILTELFFNDAVTVLVSFGLNVNMEEDDLKKIDQEATSLYLESKKNFNCHDLLKNIEKRFLLDLERFQKEGFIPFHKELEDLLAYKGKTITFFDGKEKIQGIVHSLTLDGRLNLLLPDKTIKTVLSGDISL